MSNKTKSSEFYGRLKMQKKKFNGYMAILSLILVGIICYILVIAGNSDASSYGMPIYMFMIVLFLLIFFSIRHSSSYHYVKKRYENLSQNEKELLEEDLSSMPEQKGVYFGKNYIYFKDFKYMRLGNFLSYDEIVWAYLDSNRNETIVETDTHTEFQSRLVGEYQRLVVFGTDKTRYNIEEKTTENLLHKMIKVAPCAIYGYSKEYKKLFNRNFSEFKKMVTDKKERYQSENNELDTMGQDNEKIPQWKDLLPADMEQKSIQTKGNFVLGTVGAVLGSLVGVIAWVLLYQLGYIAGISGFLMAICALGGYDKLGGKLDKKGVVISVLIVICMVYISNRLCLAVEIYKSYNEINDINFLESYQSIPIVLRDESVKRSYLADLAMGYIFSLIASFRRFLDVFKTVSES